MTVTSLFFRHCHVFISLRQFFTGLWCVRFIRLAGPQALLYFHSAEITSVSHHAWLQKKKWVLRFNSCPHAHKANTLPSEQTPSPNVCFCKPDYQDVQDMNPFFFSFLSSAPTYSYSNDFVQIVSEKQMKISNGRRPVEDAKCLSHNKFLISQASCEHTIDMSVAHFPILFMQ